MIWLVVIVPRCTVTVCLGRRADLFATPGGYVLRIGRLRICAVTYPAERIVTRWGLTMDRW